MLSNPILQNLAIYDVFYSMFGSKSCIPNIHRMKLLGCSVRKSQSQQCCTNLTSILVYLQSYI